MSTEGVDNSRRTFLVGLTAATGAVGAAVAAVPFVMSWTPSARARAAGAAIAIDISKIEEGGFVINEWRGKPVWILRRTREMVETLAAQDKDLRDPASEEPQQPVYAQNPARSIKADVLVVLGVCTHLGCSPKYVKEPTVDLSYGGFFCPCHGSKFDFAGRVYKGVPAPLNLEVPPHYYQSESVVIVGEEKGAA
ncbi:MAG: ubiquinol-cytochrome c reductase iron-sulfur subunit [Gammaproteobacteria bacterium]